MINRKQLITILAILFLSVSWFVYAIDIPRELQTLGFSEDKLVSYDKEGSEEFFTFWLNKERGETITFIVENGKVKQASEGTDAKLSEH